MTGEEFLQLYLHNIELRQYIVDQAKRHSKNVEIQEDMVQEAWLYISLCDGNSCTESLMNIAYNSIRRFYNAEVRERAELWEAAFDGM